MFVRTLVVKGRGTRKRPTHWSPERIAVKIVCISCTLLWLRIKCPYVSPSSLFYLTFKKDLTFWEMFVRKSNNDFLTPVTQGVSLIKRLNNEHNRIRGEDWRTLIDYIPCPYNGENPFRSTCLYVNTPGRINVRNSLIFNTFETSSWIQVITFFFIKGRESLQYKIIPSFYFFVVHSFHTSYKLPPFLLFN